MLDLFDVVANGGLSTSEPFSSTSRSQICLAVFFSWWVRSHLLQRRKAEHMGIRQRYGGCLLKTRCIDLCVVCISGTSNIS